MIRRGSHQTDYFVMPNAAANDKRLSFDARGILAFLLSKPADWCVNPKALATEGKIGRDKVYRILKELVAAGYARTEQGRDEHGRVTQMEYTIYDTPITADLFAPRPENTDADEPQTENQEAVSPHPENPDTGKPLPASPLTGQPYPVNPPLQSNDLDKVRNETKGPVRKREPYPSEFEEFCQAYGLDDHPNMSKKKTFDQWRRASTVVTHADLMRAVRAYRAWLDAKTGFPITGAATWLKDHGWEGFLLQMERDGGPAQELVVHMDVVSTEWRAACQRTAKRVSVPTFNSWFGRGRLVGVAPFSFKAPPFAAQRIKENLLVILEEELGEKVFITAESAKRAPERASA